MSKKCNNNLMLCPVSIDRIYDFSRATTSLSSNLPIKFDVICDCCLPCDTKIEIVETTFKYNLCKIKKSVLLNGHKIDDISNTLEDKIYLNRNYVNLVDKDCKELMLNITEHIKADFEIQAYIKGIAYINNCKKVCFEAFGEGIDKIDSIIISNACVPNFLSCIDSAYLRLKNEILGVANPEYIFISPIYDCCSNIENLLANVFVNYCISLDLKSLIPTNLNLLCQKNKKEMS